MKGGSNIKKVILKFIGTGICDKYQACVSIYDKHHNIICKELTCNGKLVLNLKENTMYILNATFCGEAINSSFYVTKYNNKFSFIFNRCMINSSNYPPVRTITFLLGDTNYNNLPIEKGEIILWQKQ